MIPQEPFKRYEKNSWRSRSRKQCHYGLPMRYQNVGSLQSRSQNMKLIISSISFRRCLLDDQKKGWKGNNYSSNSA